MIRSLALDLARLLAIAFLGCVIAIVVDPYIGFGSSLLAIVTNAVLPVLLVLLLSGLTGRAWMALLLEILVLWLVRYVDHTKVIYLGINLVYADLTVAAGFLKNPHLVVGFIHPTTAKIAGVLALIALVVALWVFLHRFWRYQLPALVNRFVRVSCLVLATVGVIVVSTCRAPDVIAPLQWEVFSQIHGAHTAGITGNVLLGMMTERSSHREPSDDKIKAFWREPAVKAAMANLDGSGSGLRPDIVIVQSESLFEPSQLCGFPDQPILKHLAEQLPHEAGSLHVPVFGGRTLQTEFEVQTGTPVGFYPDSMFAYYELVNHRFGGLAEQLDQNGYKTLAIHPGNRGFWRRDVAMPDMGFDAFEGIGSFLYPRDFSDRGHVRDAALMRTVLAELDAASGPAFVTAVTMDNHFPYGAGAPQVDAGLGIPDQLKGEARRQMADYLVHAIDADNAYGFLLEALKRRARPTIVLFYGDHMPPLGAIYQQLCFKDGRHPTEHYPPFRVWANFPIPVIPDSTYSYLLPGWLMHAAGLPLKGVMLANAVAGSIANNPATSNVVRERILGEYANIAAANVNRRDTTQTGRGAVFVGHEHALKLLMASSSQKEGAVAVSSDYHDLNFSRPHGGEVDFALDAGVTSISLRPYLGAPSITCMRSDTGAGADFHVEADDKLLYRTTVTAQSVRLVTLNLQGVRHLKLRTAGSGRSDACSQLFVRVARMRCHTAKCKGSARMETEVPAALDGESRILRDDPQAGDIAALTSIAPESVHLSGRAGSFLSWLMTKKGKYRDGYSPIMVQSDNRLFMPPGDDHSAWIEFDVSSIHQLVLSPYINPLSSDCANQNEPGKEAGVAGVDFLLDDKPVIPRFLVDRNYRGSIPINVNGAHTLRITVDKGNQVSWCDWLSIGVQELELESGVAPTVRAPLPDVMASYRDIPPPIDH